MIFKDNDLVKSFKVAFPFTLPVIMGFLFFGFSYGLYMSQRGFNFIYPLIMSFSIFAGSLEFILVNFLMGTFDPFSAFFVSFMVNARHLFYAISMLDKYRGRGLKSLYLIFGMCDESFAINYSADVPEGVDEGWFYTGVTFFNRMYWILGATTGGLVGTFLNFKINGLEFVVTALFVVIFMDQWLKEDDHTSSILGIVLSVIAIAVFGSDYFILPAILGVIVFFIVFKNRFGGGK